MPLPDVLQSPQQFAVTTPTALRQQAAALSVAIHLGQVWGEEGGWVPPALVSFERVSPPGDSRVSVTLLLERDSPPGDSRVRLLPGVENV